MRRFKIVVFVLVFVWAGIAFGEEAATEKVTAEPVKAEEGIEPIGLKCPDGLRWLPGGCYVVLDDANGRRMFVHTRMQLMQNKSATWKANDKESKDATELAEVLRAKLMKLPEVSGVRIAPRTILISVYHLDTMPTKAIESAFEVLLKKPKKK